MPDDPDHKQLRERIRDLTGVVPPRRLEIVADTSNIMNIHRGHVLGLEGEEFFVLGDVMEPRFGLDDQPKNWVKRAVDLSDGALKILKLVFLEEFVTHVGPIRMRCYRSPEKESRVLDLVRGDPRFMQGYTLHDEKGNNVRVIDFIYGKSLYDWILDLTTPHREYFFTMLPDVLTRVRECLAGAQMIHDNDLCHGDIRNDHLLIDRDTGDYRWIDFDLTQAFSDFDVWSMGNVLAFCIGQGLRTFHEVKNSDAFPASVRASLGENDASAFFRYRIMNLTKIFPYLHDELGWILRHFTVNTDIYYESISEMIGDLGRALAAWPKGGG